jgi:hypothetical protein
MVSSLLPLVYPSLIGWVVNLVAERARAAREALLTGNA